MSLEELQNNIEKIMSPMPPEMKVQWWIDNDLLPKREGSGISHSRKWSKEHPFKECPSCKKELHITEYHTRQTRCKKTGLLNITSKCKACMNIGHITTGKTRQKIYQGDAEERAYNIKLAIMEYFDNECNDCGFRGQMCQFDFDHIDPLTKKFTLGLNGLPHVNPEDILNEVSKVQMLCANCHRKHSARYEKQNMDNHYEGTASVTLTKMAEPIPDRERLRR